MPPPSCLTPSRCLEGSTHQIQYPGPKRTGPVRRAGGCEGTEKPEKVSHGGRSVLAGNDSGGMVRRRKGSNAYLLSKRGRFRTARAQRGHSAHHHGVHHGNTPCTPPPYRSVHDPVKTASGVRNAGPWDPWLPAVENTRTVCPQRVTSSATWARDGIPHNPITTCCHGQHSARSPSRTKCFTQAQHHLPCAWYRAADTRACPKLDKGLWRPGARAPSWEVPSQICAF
jgi:hypothetical protein